MNTVKERLQLIIGRFPGFEPGLLRLCHSSVPTQLIRDVLIMIETLEQRQSVSDPSLLSRLKALRVELREKIVWMRAKGKDIWPLPQIVELDNLEAWADEIAAIVKDLERTEEIIEPEPTAEDFMNDEPSGGPN